MSKTLNIIWQYLRAFVLIYACLYAGIFIASLLPVTIPGSIIGMLILFVLLALQNSSGKMGQSGVLRTDSLYGAIVCADWRRRHAIF